MAKIPAISGKAFLCLVLMGAYPSAHAAKLTSPSPDLASYADLSALMNHGQYWFNRYRYDLATQAFNKVLVIQPGNAEAMKWKGLIDINSGNIQAAQLWLDKLQTEVGSANPHAVELRQSLEIATTKRQQVAEIQYLAGRGGLDGDSMRWFKELSALFDAPPLGEAAILYYSLQAKFSEEQKQLALNRVRGLIKAFPDDPRYRKLMTDLGGRAPVVAAQIAQAKAVPNKPKLPATKAVKTIDQAQPKVEAKPENIAQPEPEQVPEPNDFEKGQALADEAQALIKQGDLAKATRNLEQAVALNPDYAWFRYDLAILLDDQGGTESRSQAQFIMETGRQISPKDSDMTFASALLASRQNRESDALAYLDNIPKEQWTQGMGALARRIEFGQFLVRDRKSVV